MNDRMDEVFNQRHAPRQLDDSERNQLADLQHEACEDHCTECGACDWRSAGPTTDEHVPIVNGLCPDCLPQS